MVDQYPLTDKIRLRNSTVWQNYARVKTLIRPYGTVRLKPVQYGNTGRKWLVGDFQIQAVLGVYIRGALEATFEWHNDIDSNGIPIAFVFLNRSVSEEDIEVVVQGRIHPITGLLMTNPADVIWDILTLFRSDLDLTAVDDYRRECTEFGLEANGVLKDHTETGRTILDEIAVSFGSVWSGGISSYFRLYPRETTPDYEPVLTYFNKENIYQVSGIADHIDLYTVLRIRYDYNFATGEPQSVLQLEAPEQAKSVEKGGYGRIVKELDFKWVNSTKQAIETGTRLLQYMARPHWKPSWKSTRETKSGNYVNFEYPTIPKSGNVMILSSVLPANRPENTYGCEFPMGPIPEIVITQDSEIFDAV